MSDDSKPISREEIETKYGSGPTEAVRKNPYLTALAIIGIAGTLLGLFLLLVPSAFALSTVLLGVGVSSFLLWLVAGAIVVAIEATVRR
ncbi:hypothetical protein ACL9RL_06090 [Plantibacter sp. Mn2098]|uniref:hypothetical protein n=1 Tax=Plantibacter sp. Mn2098 TaxID=3395266 RepID=UPI003BE439A6